MYGAATRRAPRRSRRTHSRTVKPLHRPRTRVPFPKPLSRVCTRRRRASFAPTSIQAMCADDLPYVIASGLETTLPVQPTGADRSSGTTSLSIRDGYLSLLPEAAGMVDRDERLGD